MSARHPIPWKSPALSQRSKRLLIFCAQSALRKSSVLALLPCREPLNNQRNSSATLIKILKRHGRVPCLFLCSANSCPYRNEVVRSLVPRYLFKVKAYDKFYRRSNIPRIKFIVYAEIGRIARHKTSNNRFWMDTNFSYTS